MSYHSGAEAAHRWMSVSSSVASSLDLRKSCGLDANGTLPDVLFCPAHLGLPFLAIVRHNLVSPLLPDRPS
jgi:hypothetical protein